MAHMVPDGGLHPVAYKPGTALFGFITEKLGAAMNKQSPPGVFESMGNGVAPAAKAAGKALGESISAQ
jgi:hypothetical protein